jgi:hypothetical protein
MNGAGTTATATSSSTSSGGGGTSKRRVKKQTVVSKLPSTTTNGHHHHPQKYHKSTASTITSTYLMVFVFLFVLTDMMYLYKISSQALMDDPNHSSTLKATYLSRIGSSSSAGGAGGRAVENGEPAAAITTAVDLYREATEKGYRNMNDKGPILEILSQAGLTIDDIDQHVIDALPTWTQVQTLYGTEPRIVGLETCTRFVQSVDPTVRFFGVAGTFNSGTNLVAELMSQNCQITERMEVYGRDSRGIRWQVRTAELYIYVICTYTEKMTRTKEYHHGGCFDFLFSPCLTFCSIFLVTLKGPLGETLHGVPSRRTCNSYR